VVSACSPGGVVVRFISFVGCVRVGSASGCVQGLGIRPFCPHSLRVVICISYVSNTLLINICPAGFVIWVEISFFPAVVLMV
jgi:hypothetical protein